jgi:hypothetical protein
VPHACLLHAAPCILSQAGAIAATIIAAAAATAAEMVLKMPVVLSKHEALLESFRTGVGLSFDGTGIDHIEKHRHAVRVCGTQKPWSMRCYGVVCWVSPWSAVQLPAYSQAERFMHRHAVCV